MISVPCRLSQDQIGCYIEISMSICVASMEDVYIWLVDCLEILPPIPMNLADNLTIDCWQTISPLEPLKHVNTPESVIAIDSCYWNGVFIQWQYTIHSTTKRRCLKSSSTANDKLTLSLHHFLRNLLVTCVFFHFPIPSYLLPTSQPWSIAEPLEYV